jgi:hypothetical protein
VLWQYTQRECPLCSQRYLAHSVIPHLCRFTGAVGTLE